MEEDQKLYIGDDIAIAQTRYGKIQGYILNGANLAKAGNIVFVSVNHRLNAFGFTDFSKVGIPGLAQSGNVGLLDIVAALGWVRDNISQFGGDPNCEILPRWPAYTREDCPTMVFSQDPELRMAPDKKALELMDPFNPFRMSILTEK